MWYQYTPTLGIRTHRVKVRVRVRVKVRARVKVKVRARVRVKVRVTVTQILPGLVSMTAAPQTNTNGGSNPLQRNPNPKI